MADEDITLDGKPLQSLRVADLKAALEQRNLPKSGQKNTLIKRLKGALMLENLQKSSSSNSGLQPNSQIGEEMCQNSFIKQYLAKQQELLRQRLEREAQQEEEADESPGGPEEDEDHSEDNDNSSFVSDKNRTILSQPSMAKPDFRGEYSMMGRGPGPTLHHQESPEALGLRIQRGQGHREPPAPSPPRAVASLSVRVLGQPDCQGLPSAIPQTQEKEGTAPNELGSAHSVPHLSRSARSSAGNHVRDDSDKDDDDDESDNDEDWGPTPGRARRKKRALPPVVQTPPSVPLAAARSKRKLQPPQHIPPAQAHPTPPPSPPPDMFSLPDTPKQSPPNTDDQDGEGPIVQNQYSDSSSRSSSPEPSGKRRPGPLSLLIHKMESEEATSAPSMIGEAHQSTAGCSSEFSLQVSVTKKQQESREKEEQRRLKEEKEREQQHDQERERNLEKEKEKNRKQLKEEKQNKCLEDEKRREEKQLKEGLEKELEKANKDRMVVTEAQDAGSSSESDSKSRSSQTSSSSSSSPGDKTQPPSQLKKQDQEQQANDEKNTNLSKRLEKQYLSQREVSEPSTAAITEVEPDSESSMAEQPVSSAEPESSESRLEEVPMPLPLPLLVSAAYYYYHQQHLFHSSYSYNSCPTMRKCVAGT